MSVEWHDWHAELSAATKAYNALLKRLAEQQNACVAIETLKRRAITGIDYDELEWHCYAAPQARSRCVECGLAEADGVHGAPRIKRII